MLDSLSQDIRFAARSLARTPGFTTVAVLTLALGIGANTAIFSVVNTVLLRPLPYENSQQLVSVYENIPPPAGSSGPTRRIPGIAVRELIELRTRSRTLSHTISHGVAMVTAACGDEAVRLFGTTMSVSAWPMLGVRPAIGRWFTQAEETPGADTVVMLSDSAWQRCFQRDLHVVGKTLTFTGRAPGGLGGTVPLNVPFTIVGVMPATFWFPGDAVQFWTPMVLTMPADGRPRRTSMMARLADGISIDAAVAELRAIVQDVRGEKTPFDSHRFELIRVQEETAARVRPALLVLAAAVGLVLLIACANVANLLLTRAAARRREIAIRIALGAGRLRLIRQTLTDSVLLALAGGAAGILLASGGVRLFRALGTNLPRFDLRTGATFPRLLEVGVDRSVLLFALAASVVTGLLFGVVPALRLSREAPMYDLRGPRAGSCTQDVLVVAQLALATLLFVGGTLLVRSFVKLASVDPGYDPSNVLTFQIAVPGERGTAAELRGFAESIASRLQAIRGVQAAGYANQLPMVGLRDTAGGLWRTPDPLRPPPPIGPDARFVSRGYLSTMGIPVVAGRGFSEADGFGQPRVLLINQALASSDFPGENPIGQRVYIFRSADPWEIVGVVGNVRQFGLDRAAEPQFFVDVRQWPANGPPMFPGGAYYAVRTTGDSVAAVAAIRRTVREVDARSSLDNIASMQSIVANSIGEPRLYAVLLGVFAAIAIALAAIGVYGVVAYAVLQRTREIGIRMALGAHRAAVMGLVLRQAAAVTVIGIGCGIGAAAAVSTYLRGLLFGLTPLDPSTYVGVALLFAAIAMFASSVPARRATKVDPLVALRSE